MSASFCTIINFIIKLEREKMESIDNSFNMQNSQQINPKHKSQAWSRRIACRISGVGWSCLSFILWKSIHNEGRIKFHGSWNKWSHRYMLYHYLSISQWSRKSCWIFKTNRKLAVIFIKLFLPFLKKWPICFR